MDNKMKPNRGRPKRRVDETENSNSPAKIKKSKGTANLDAMENATDQRLSDQQNDQQTFQVGISTRNRKNFTRNSGRNNNNVSVAQNILPSLDIPLGKGVSKPGANRAWMQSRKRN